MISKAWLLYKTPVGETSYYLGFLTEDFGVIQCRFKGSRVPKKQALLQPFMPLWVEFSQRYSFNFVKTIEPLGPLLRLSGRPLFCALYLNELIHYALKPMDSYPNVVAAYQYTLAGLEQARCDHDLPLEQLLRQFEWLLLKECGYQLDASQLIPFALSQEISTSILQGTFNADSLPAAKIIMRGAIQLLIDNRELKTRRLFSSFKTKSF